MAGFQGSFDATQFEPIQSAGLAPHPIGKYPARIVGTSCEQVKDKDKEGLFKVEFETPAGRAIKRYNLWITSPQAVEIAHKELSALCYATGVFRLNFMDEGAALRGAQLQIEVGWQKGNEPTQEKPGGGYTEIKKVFDANGNEPGKQNAAPQPQAQQWGGGQPQQQAPQQAAPAPASAPMQQQPGGGWGSAGTVQGGQAPNGPAPAAPAPGAWQPPTAPAQAAPAPNAPPWVRN